jgi:hypothetical protein
MLQRIKQAAKDDWRAAAEWLRLTFPNDYRKPSKLMSRSPLQFKWFAAKSIGKNLLSSESDFNSPETLRIFPAYARSNQSKQVANIFGLQGLLTPAAATLPFGVRTRFCSRANFVSLLLKKLRP